MGESIEESDDFAKELVLIEKNARKPDANESSEAIIQHKLDVFNNFHRILAARLSEALKPAHQFFNTNKSSYYISLKSDRIDLNGFILVTSYEPLTRESVGNRISVIENAKSILYWISFNGVKERYNMKDISMEVKANVVFDLQGYTFNGVKYNYGKYPDMEVIDRFISEQKAYVLKHIKEASN